MIVESIVPAGIDAEAFESRPGDLDKLRQADLVVCIGLGYDFWLDVITNREADNYRGMVCSFITSIEYQNRFSSMATHSNSECAGVH